MCHAADFLHQLTAFEQGAVELPPVFMDPMASTVDHQAAELIADLWHGGFPLMGEDGVPTIQAFMLADRIDTADPIMLLRTARALSHRYEVIRQHVVGNQATADDLQQITKLNRVPASFDAMVPTRLN